MSKNVFFVSDTHFGHENTCTKFVKEDGSPLRPFANAQEMDEEMVKRWNETVRPNDKVYHLGDVVIARRHLSTLSRLNGDKVLVKGNHDIFKLSDYTEYFRDIRSYRVFTGEKFIASHIPVHESQLEYRWKANVHGHLHANLVMKNGVVDDRYINVSVEQIDFRPIAFEEIVKRIRDLDG